MNTNIHHLHTHTHTHSEFLQRGASSEVNVSANIQNEVEKDVKNPSRYAFTAAQEQIYHLMQNDIYPRFLKSKEYQDMLKGGKSLDNGGRGFFSRFQYGQRKFKLEAGARDATGISPCLPQRYTRRQVSMSQLKRARLHVQYIYYYTIVLLPLHCTYMYVLSETSNSSRVDMVE